MHRTQPYVCSIPVCTDLDKHGGQRTGGKGQLILEMTKENYVHDSRANLAESQMDVR